MTRGHRGDADLPPGPARDLTDLLRRLRPRRGLSVGQIAISAGLSRSHVSEVLRGWKTPSPRAAAAIAGALGASDTEVGKAHQWAGQAQELQDYQRIHRRTPARHIRPAPPAAHPDGGGQPVASPPGAAAAADRDRAGPAGTAEAGGTTSPQAVRRTLPRDVADFTGRQNELDRLAGVRAGSGGVVRIHAISGMAGVGKTVLAVHAAHRLAPQFPDGQLFVALHGHTPGQRPVEPAGALASLLVTAGIPGSRIPPGLAERAALWRDHLVGRRMLIVLDDAVSSGQVEPLLPGSAGCLVLVTSRRHLTALEDAQVVSLNVLPRAEAADLLVALAGRPGLDG